MQCEPSPSGSSGLRVGGIVLCGGESRRMGSAKAWLPFGDELMLPRVVRVLRSVVRPVVVVAAVGQELPPLPSDVAVVRDEAKGLGPLQGFFAGLNLLGDTVDAVYLSSCDLPLLRSSFVQRMIALLGENTVCVAKVGDFVHPLAAVYRVTIREVVRGLLHSGQLRMTAILDALPTRYVEAEECRDCDPNLDSLRNLNSPEDYTAALRDYLAQPKATC